MFSVTPLDHARLAWRQGLTPIPVPFKGKNPNMAGWQHARVRSEEELARAFALPELNIGVLLGEPSNGATDIDLDTQEAICIATEFLPTTWTFGRRSKRRSHWIFKADPTGSTTQFKDPTTGEMLVEYRSTGVQTVWVGSVHESGEPVESDDPTPVATIEGDVLLGKVRHLAAATILARHWPKQGRPEAACALAGILTGWSAATIEHFINAVGMGAGEADAATHAFDAAAHPSATPLAIDPIVVYTAQKWLGLATAVPRAAIDPSTVPSSRRARRAAAYLKAIPHAVAHKGGHDHTWRAAITLTRGFALDREVALDLLLTHYNPRCEPPWSVAELNHKIDDAMTSDLPLGYLLKEEKEETPEAGSASPSVPAPIAARPFPTHAFPPSVARWIVEEAEATQTPPDLAGVLALTVLAAAAAKRASLLVMPGYFEPLNLFTAVALEPGERKSAVFRHATKPIVDFQRRAAKDAEPEIQEAQQRQRILDAQYKTALRKAAKGDEEADAEAQRLAIELDELVVPVSPRLIADDVTPEKLINLMVQHGGAMAVLSAEGGIFETIAGRYSSNVPNMDVLLKGHAGDQIQVDRLGRSPDFVPHPALTMGLAVQPSVIRDLGSKPGFKGRGLIARFLISHPVSRVGSRSFHPPPVHPDASAAYAETITAILGLPRVPDDATGVDAHILKLSDGALETWRSFASSLEPRLDPRTGDVAAAGMGDWGSKLPGAIARIAGLLHLANFASCGAPWRVEVTSDCMNSAIELGCYFLDQSIVTNVTMSPGVGDDLTERVWRTIEALRTPMVVRREIQRRMHRQFPTGDKIQPHLDALVEDGRLSVVTAIDPVTNRIPKGHYLVTNPLQGGEGCRVH